MHTYVQRRIDTIPRLLTQSEASAIAEWVVQLGDSFDEGVRLLGRTQASLNDQRMLLLDLNDTNAHAQPESAAKLVAHVLTNTEPTRFWDHSALQQFVGIVKYKASAEVVDRIRSGALRLGIGGAQEW